MYVYIYVCLCIYLHLHMYIESKLGIQRERYVGIVRGVIGIL